MSVYVLLLSATFDCETDPGLFYSLTIQVGDGDTSERNTTVDMTVYVEPDVTGGPKFEAHEGVTVPEDMTIGEQVTQVNSC